MIRIGINGFGRIGRLVLRAICDQGLLDKEIDVVAVNDLVPADNLAYLLKYDSIHGRGKGEVSSRKSSFDLAEDDILVVDGHTIKCLTLREGPAALPWRELGIDVVIESTGLFTDAERARGHLIAGAKKVIITAAARGEDITLVMGVNHEKYDPSRHHILSASTGLTNALAPMFLVLLRKGSGFEHAFVTLLQSVSSTSRLQDVPQRHSHRGGRSAINIIPSPTGAAKAVGLVIPELKGKLDGVVFRVPVAGPCVVDLTVTTVKETSYEEISAATKKASETYLKGVLGWTDDEVVSTDFIHDSHSSTFDAGSGIERNSRFFKLVSWYDPEWSYSCRVVDLLRLVARHD